WVTCSTTWTVSRTSGCRPSPKLRGWSNDSVAALLRRTRYPVPGTRYSRWAESASDCSTIRGTGYGVRGTGPGGGAVIATLTLGLTFNDWIGEPVNWAFLVIGLIIIFCAWRVVTSHNV